MNGIDCATKLTSTIARNLKNEGIQAVGRYLGGNYGITSDEVKAIHNAGLSLFLIYETYPTHMEYFTYDQGLTDSQQAIKIATSLGAPSGTAIYFTVDYDAQPSDFVRIEGYFEGVTKGIGKYLPGIYGSYSVLSYLSQATYKPKRYFQTYAWSNGKIFPGNHIYQHLCDTKLAGIGVDLDTINNPNTAGMWSI